MPQYRTVIQPTEIEHIEIHCQHCGKSAILALEDTPPPGPEKPLGDNSLHRCLWCNKQFNSEAPGFQTVLEELRRSLSLLRRLNVPFVVRLIVKQ